MRSYKLLLLFIACCWSCSSLEVGIEEETLPDAELNLFSETVKVSDLLADNSPKEFKQAAGRILSNALGEKLLLKVKYIPDRPLISFFPIEDANGNLDRESPGELRYYGGGRIGYNYNILQDPNNDELLFHEFFHFFQNGNSFPNRNLNNEVEAYVAQYLYARSKSGNKVRNIINITFTKIIEKLADDIDKSTGNLSVKADLDKFYKNYQAALDHITMFNAYKDEGWFRENIDRTKYPFPNIQRLLKS